MPDSTTVISQHWLGTEPYVLLTAALGDDGPDDLRIIVRAGGGVTSMDDTREMLLMALPEMGLTEEEAVALLDGVRARSAGTETSDG
jgi:hypothetical protein